MIFQRPLVWLRHFVFYVSACFWTLFLSLSIVLFIFLPRNCSFWISRCWARGLSALARIFLGIHYRVQGKELFSPYEEYIVASKHQSSWETFSFWEIFPNPVFVLKKSLLWIPFLGWYFYKQSMIPVSRGKNQDFLKRAHQAIVVEKRPIIIFPEGTRTVLGAKQRYHTGIYTLYRNLGIPVVPVALNSGAFWPRRKFFKHPGTIDLVFLPPIPPGLEKEAFMALLFSRIEEKSQNLLALAPRKEG